MILKITRSSRFKKDVKKCQKRGLKMQKLTRVIEDLSIPLSREDMARKYKDHALIGDFSGSRELHIQPDWLLIYEIIGDTLFLDRTGTHSDLFG